MRLSTLAATLSATTAVAALALAPLSATLGPQPAGDGKAAATEAGADLVARASQARLQNLPCLQDMSGPFQCDSVDLVDNIPVPLFGGEGHGSDSWGWTDDNGTPKKAGDDTDYVIVTTGDGHGFFRLADTGHAQYLGTLPRSYTQDDGGTPVLWNDVKVVNDHAYITAEDSSSRVQYGIQIVDMRRIAELGPVSPLNGLRYLTEDGWFGEGLAGHNLVGFEEADVLGIVLGEDEQCGGQLVLFDVARKPTEPRRLGCVDPDAPGIGNVPVNENGNPVLGGRIDPHDAHCVVYAGPDADYNGAGADGRVGTADDVDASHVCALFGQESGGMYLVDVSDITRDRTVKAADGGRGGELINRFTYATMNYAHQGWFTDDHQFVMWGDELDESGAAALGVGGGGPAAHQTNTTTYWVDVSDLDVGVKQTDPTAIHGVAPDGPDDEGQPAAFRVNEDLVGAWSNPSTVSIDHNMYSVGNLLFQANYGAGLRVLEFTPESLRGDDRTQAFTEVAYYDTYPGPGPSEFYGAWNVYPFFGLDRIVLSDFQSGLLILDATDLLPDDPDEAPAG